MKLSSTPIIKMQTISIPLSLLLGSEVGVLGSDFGLAGAEVGCVPELDVRRVPELGVRRVPGSEVVRVPGSAVRRVPSMSRPEIGFGSDIEGTDCVVFFRGS